MKTLFLELLTHFAGISSAFWALLEPVLLASGKTFLADATTAAVPIVTDLENATIPSADKRAQALTALEAAFTKDGKTLLVSVANLAVELALQKVRAAL